MRARSVWGSHLHHDVPHFIVGAIVRLRLMQFSIYPRGKPTVAPATLAAPLLIGRERERDLG